MSSPVCFLKSLLIVAIFVEVLCSCRIVGNNLYLHLAAFSILPEKKIILVKLRTLPTNSKVFLRGCMDMREKQISTSVIKIQKEKKVGANHAFFKDN